VIKNAFTFEDVPYPYDKDSLTFPFGLDEKAYVRVKDLARIFGEDERKFMESFDRRNKDTFETGSGPELPDLFRKAEELFKLLRSVPAIDPECNISLKEIIELKKKSRIFLTKQQEPKANSDKISGNAISPEQLVASEVHIVAPPKSSLNIKPSSYASGMAERLESHVSVGEGDDREMGSMAPSFFHGRRGALSECVKEVEHIMDLLDNFRQLNCRMAETLLIQLLRVLYAVTQTQEISYLDTKVFRSCFLELFGGKTVVDKCVFISQEFFGGRRRLQRLTLCIMDLIAAGDEDCRWGLVKHAPWITSVATDENFPSDSLCELAVRVLVRIFSSPACGSAPFGLPVRDELPDEEGAEEVEEERRIMGNGNPPVYSPLSASGFPTKASTDRAYVALSKDCTLVSWLLKTLRRDDSPSGVVCVCCMLLTSLHNLEWGSSDEDVRGFIASISEKLANSGEVGCLLNALRGGDAPPPAGISVLQCAMAALQSCLSCGGKEAAVVDRYGGSKNRKAFMEYHGFREVVLALQNFCFAAQLPLVATITTAFHAVSVLGWVCRVGGQRERMSCVEAHGLAVLEQVLHLAAMEDLEGEERGSSDTAATTVPFQQQQRSYITIQCIVMAAHALSDILGGGGGGGDDGGLQRKDDFNEAVVETVESGIGSSLCLRLQIALDTKIFRLLLLIIDTDAFIESEDLCDGVLRALMSLTPLYYFVAIAHNQEELLLSDLWSSAPKLITKVLLHHGTKSLRVVSTVFRFLHHTLRLNLSSTSSSYSSSSTSSCVSLRSYFWRERSFFNTILSSLDHISRSCPPRVYEDLLRPFRDVLGDPFIPRELSDFLHASSHSTVCLPSLSTLTLFFSDRRRLSVSLQGSGQVNNNASTITELHPSPPLSLRSITLGLSIFHMLFAGCIVMGGKRPPQKVIEEVLEGGFLDALPHLFDLCLRKFDLDLPMHLLEILRLMLMHGGKRVVSALLFLPEDGGLGGEGVLEFLCDRLLREYPGETCILEGVSELLLTLVTPLPPSSSYDSPFFQRSEPSSSSFTPSKSFFPLLRACKQARVFQVLPSALRHLLLDYCKSSKQPSVDHPLPPIRALTSTVSCLRKLCELGGTPVREECVGSDILETLVMALRQFGKEEEEGGGVLSVCEEIVRTLCVFLSAAEEEIINKNAGAEATLRGESQLGRLPSEGGGYTSGRASTSGAYAKIVARSGGAIELYYALCRTLPRRYTRRGGQQKAAAAVTLLPHSTTLLIAQALTLLGGVPLYLSNLAKVDLAGAILDHLEYHVRYPQVDSPGVLDALGGLITEYYFVVEWEEGGWGDFSQGVRGALPLLTWSLKKYGETLCPSLPMAISALSQR